MPSNMTVSIVGQPASDHALATTQLGKAPSASVFWSNEAALDQHEARMLVDSTVEPGERACHARRVCAEREACAAHALHAPSDLTVHSAPNSTHIHSASPTFLHSTFKNVSDVPVLTVGYELQ